MSLDILKKLIKLANHNPNENESNAAARKVCKMLEENNFNLLGGGTITPPSPPPFTRPRAAQDIDFEELVRRAREADATRKKQQEERERKAKEAPHIYHFNCSVCLVEMTSRNPRPDAPLCLKCKYKKATGKEWGI